MGWHARTGAGTRRALVVALLGVLLAGCASFADAGPREWRDKVESTGELGGPPSVQQPPPPTVPQPPDGQEPEGTAPQLPPGCDDPDPQVVATCLAPVGAIAVLPDGRSALVAERTTGRVLRVERGTTPLPVTTVPVEAAGGGGLTGLVLSPSFAEDQLVYALATTADDQRVLRIAPNEPPKPVLTGIPRAPGGALGTDRSGALLVATGDPGGGAGDPASLAGKLLRVDTLGRPATGNPNPASPVYSSGLVAPQGLCTSPQGATWVTDRAPGRDVLHLVRPGPLPAPAWTWPDRPGVGGCSVQAQVLAVAMSRGKSVFVLRPGDNGTFTGNPETLLPDAYGRLGPAAGGPDGLLWLGTVNKDGSAGASPKSSDDRVVRIQPPSGGGASRA